MPNSQTSEEKYQNTTLQPFVLNKATYSPKLKSGVYSEIKKSSKGIQPKKANARVIVIVLLHFHQSGSGRP